MIDFRRLMVYARLLSVNRENRNRLNLSEENVSGEQATEIFYEKPTRNRSSAKERDSAIGALFADYSARTGLCGQLLNQWSRADNFVASLEFQKPAFEPSI